MRFRLTPAADQDIADILRESARHFGPLQRARYAALIERAAAMIAERPDRPGSRNRDELAPGIRSFSVELAARRRGAASHVLYYLEDRRDGGIEIVIVRVLHQSMEPERHVVDVP